MAERILEAELDAELLRRNRLGESQAALARAFGCSKSLVQRRIARATLAELRLPDEPARTRTDRPPPAVGPSIAEAHAPIDVRSELERIVRDGKDTRSVLSALKELRTIGGDTPSPTPSTGRKIVERCQHCGGEGLPATARTWTFDWGQSVIIADVTCPHCGGNLAENADLWLVRNPADREPEPTHAHRNS